MFHGHNNCVHQDKKRNCILKVSMIDQVKEYLLAVLRLVYLDPQLFALSDLLNFNPAPLLLCHEHVSKLFLLLDGVKVINDYSHEKIDDELRANNHERYKEYNEGNICILFGLL